MKDNEDSIFTKIIKGELPSHKVYENDLTIAILSIRQIAHGKVLVIPKKQIDQFFELDDPDYIALMQTVKKVALRMKEILKTDRIGIKVEGVDIPHVHFHLIAFNNHSEFEQEANENAPIDHEALNSMAEKLAF